jgi:glycerol uptake facilitator-like aquaporin
MYPSTSQKLIAEAMGTMLLLSIVIGSGIMAERLAQGNLAIALLANTLATVLGLFVLIEIFAPVSGAHFNPAVSMVMVLKKEMPWTLGCVYVICQLFGGLVGAWLAHAMFDLPILQTSTKIRSGSGQWLAELVATSGLILVILRAPETRTAQLVAAYIGAAYWFTASTSFANPAAAFGRLWTDSFAGISPDSVPAFIGSQCLGALLGFLLNKFFSQKN